jgi:predicted phage tail protein
MSSIFQAASLEASKQLTFYSSRSQGLPERLSGPAAHYEMTSEVARFTDTQNPGPIIGLAATGSVNSINLSWEPDTDGIGVVNYQVYGSIDPSVPVNSSTLVGQPPVPGFQHAGLGLQQQWYYRVRAVDGAGHLGPISGVVSAQTGP